MSAYASGHILSQIPLDDWGLGWGVVDIVGARGCGDMVDVGGGAGNVGGDCLDPNGCTLKGDVDVDLPSSPALKRVLLKKMLWLGGVGVGGSGGEGVAVDPLFFISEKRDEATFPMKGLFSFPGFVVPPFLFGFEYGLNLFPRFVFLIILP